jgi:lipopolysaccharide biosynthesis glycosyltransferase
MYSLEKNFVSKFNFQILCLAEVSLKRLELALKQKGISHEFSFIDFSMTDGQLSEKLHPKSAYLKCFIGDALHSSTLQPSERVLYLDVDILLLKSMSFIFSRLEEVDNGSMISARIEKGRHLHHELVYDLEEYFNTGVMFIDYKKMYLCKFSEIFLERLEIYGTLPMADQDYFNIILKNSNYLNELPIEFNHLFTPFDRSTKKAYIVHFAGTSKPWNKFGWNSFFTSWRKYHNINYNKIQFTHHLMLLELFKLFYNRFYAAIFPVYLRLKRRIKVI